MAHRRVPVDALSRATDGHLERSDRYGEIFGPAGIGEDLRAALTIDGSTWGYLGLHRDQAPFNDVEAGYLGQLTRPLAEAVRTALLLNAGAEPRDEDAPGVLLLDENLNVESANAAALRWMS